MQIILAKTAGFCFGVNRAVKLTYELLEQGRPVATLGPLIHNPQVVEDLESKGAITCDSVDDVPDGYEVVIRSHGVGQSVYDKISTRRLAYHDATCPFVTKIHKIAARAGAEGAMLLVAGDAKTPRSTGNCWPYYGKSGSVCQLGRAGKTAAGTHTTKIYFCGSANHFQCPKLGNLQGIFEKPVYKCQNI